jgi:hypothetical protein
LLKPVPDTVLEALRDVNAPVEAAVLPIGPGDEKRLVKPVPLTVLDALSVVNAPVLALVFPIVAPFTLLGVIAPNESVMAGVVVGLATVPLTPLAVATDTVVTVPDPGLMVLQPNPVPRV